MKNNTVAFTFSSSEVNKISQNFIKIVELCTGKLTLKKLYDQYDLTLTLFPITSSCD